MISMFSYPGVSSWGHGEENELVAIKPSIAVVQSMKKGLGYYTRAFGPICVRLMSTCSPLLFPTNRNPFSKTSSHNPLPTPDTTLLIILTNFIKRLLVILIQLTSFISLSSTTNPSSFRVLPDCPTHSRYVSKSSRSTMRSKHFVRQSICLEP